MLTSHSPDRCGLLRGPVTLPLIGGGVTLIGQPAVRVPLMDVAAAPLLDDPRARARYAWQAFASAMREITAGSTGWQAWGGERMHAVGYMKAEKPWVQAKAVRTVPMQGIPAGLVDEADEVTL